MPFLSEVALAGRAPLPPKRLVCLLDEETLEAFADMATESGETLVDLLKGEVRP